MNWYVAHIIVYVKFKDDIQDKRSASAEPTINYVIFNSK